MRKVELLARFHEERAKWDRALVQVGGLYMFQSGAVGSWSIKDLIAHTTAYEHFLLDRLNKSQRGLVHQSCKTPQELTSFLHAHNYPDFSSPLLTNDEANEIVYQTHRNRSLLEIAKEGWQIYQQLIQALAALPEDQISEQLCSLVARCTYEHYSHHCEHVYSWLDRLQLPYER